MSIETGPSTRGSEGSTEPVVFRSETIELRFPSSAFSESGIVAPSADESRRPIVSATAQASEPKRGVLPMPSKQPDATHDVVSAWKKDLAAHEQKHWQKVLEMGDYTPYDKAKKPIKWDAFREASYEWITDPGKFIKNAGRHIRKIDYEFRGEKDIGGAKERLERVAALTGIITIFTAFDVATSRAAGRFLPIIKDKEKNGTEIKLSSDQLWYNAKNKAMRKLVNVMNDKYATALGNILAERLSGKRGFIHEVADKGADTIQEGFGGTLDKVNGATLESYMRIISQVPIAGALFEQGMTRIAMWQEKSSLHTATGKMLYMALGVFIGESRAASTQEKAELIALAAARAAF